MALFRADWEAVFHPHSVVGSTIEHIIFQTWLQPGLYEHLSPAKLSPVCTEAVYYNCHFGMMPYRLQSSVFIYLFIYFRGTWQLVFFPMLHRWWGGVTMKWHNLINAQQYIPALTKMSKCLTREQSLDSPACIDELVWVFLFWTLSFLTRRHWGRSMFHPVVTGNTFVRCATLPTC